MQFREFQNEDYARVAMVNGAVLGHDTGLGKGLAAFTLPLLWLGWKQGRAALPRSQADQQVRATIVPKGRVLLVIPGGLHDDCVLNGRKYYGITPTRLPDQPAFHRLTQHGRDPLPDGFYLTSYTELTRNGVAKPPATHARGVGDEREYVTRDGRRHVVRCLFSPTLADLGVNAFDCVVVDEGVRLQGADSLVGTGIRRLQPRYRLVLTGTPIKNRLQQIFFLLVWAAESMARFPYAPTAQAQREFMKMFQVKERNVVHGTSRLTAEACNLHLLWKLIAPLLLRRRKDDCGEDVVKKIRQVIRVPQGTHQAKVYRYHLLTRHWDSRGRLTVLPALTACRIAAADPTSACLVETEESHRQPEREALARLPFRSPKELAFTPKLAATLKVIHDIVASGEQFLFGCAFADGVDTLAAWLRDAGVGFGICDGRLSEAKRAELARAFHRERRFPGLLCNEESMAEGYDFWQVRHVVIHSSALAWDKEEQFINRVHRLVSPHDVTVWKISCDGSIDQRLEDAQAEKGATSELVLDGRLISAPAQELNLADIYFEALEQATGETVDERKLLAEWPRLRDQLRAAMRKWAVGSMASNIIELPITESVSIGSRPVVRRFSLRERLAGIGRG